MGTSLDASRETRPYPAPEPIAAVLLFCRNTCIAPVAPPACCPKSSATAPVMFLISSRPQLPAPLSVPSAQFRKGRGPGHNRRKHYAIFKELPPFRNWALGQSREVGSWQEDAFQGHGHDFWATIGAGSSGGYGYIANDSQKTSYHPVKEAKTSNYGPVRVATETRPVNVSIPIIIYLGHRGRGLWEY